VYWGLDLAYAGFASPAPRMADALEWCNADEVVDDIMARSNEQAAAAVLAQADPLCHGAADGRITMRPYAIRTTRPMPAGAVRESPIRESPRFGSRPFVVAPTSFTTTGLLPSPQSTLRR